MNLYYVMFGLTRPSCLPLPELGLVLNLKEKKAVLNPTIKPEIGVGALADTPASIGIHGVGMSYLAVSALVEGTFYFPLNFRLPVRSGSHDLFHPLTDQTGDVTVETDR